MNAANAMPAHQGSMFIVLCTVRPARQGGGLMRKSLITTCGALLAFAVTSAHAHDRWANGDPVPSWVKRACCGPDDVHHLNRDQVRQTPDGWRVDGYPDPIPIGTEQPSPDGEYWIFYRTLDNGDKTRVYCFFTPFQGT